MPIPYYPYYGPGNAVYVDPMVVTFTVTPPIAELGSTVPAVTLGWTLSKDAGTLSLNGEAIQPNTQLLYIEGPFTEQTTWKLADADDLETAFGSVSLLFQNKIYYDFVASAPTDSAGILGLENSAFASSYVGYETIGSPVGLVFCYCYPTRFGLPILVNLKIPSGVWQPPTINSTFQDYTVTTVSFTNESGFTEDYYVLTFNYALPYPSTRVEFLDQTVVPYYNNVGWDEIPVDGTDCDCGDGNNQWW